jgi:hypothetical protein
MDYEQETDGDDESSGENLLRNAPDAAQSVQKRRRLVIESSDESDADVDGGDKDIGADGSMGMDNKDNEDEDAVSIEDVNDCLSDLPVLPEPILSNRH